MQLLGKKRCEIQGGSQEMAVMVGSIQLKEKATQIHLNCAIKYLPLTYHHSHLLANTLDFTYFITLSFLGAASFFTAWLFWYRLLISCQPNCIFHITQYNVIEPH